MTDYAEHLATKSAELAELTRALNAHHWQSAIALALKIQDDIMAVRKIAECNAKPIGTMELAAHLKNKQNRTPDEDKLVAVLDSTERYLNVLRGA